MVYRVNTPEMIGSNRSDVISWDATNAAVVAIGTASAQSATLAAGVYRLIATSSAWIARGANPTASAAAGSAYLAINTPEYLYLETAEKIAVIQDSAAGNLSICPAKEA